MTQLPIPNVWIAMGAGVVLWLIGQKLFKRQLTSGGVTRTAHIVSLLGIGLFFLGLYAGFLGPVKIGPVTLESFPLVGHYMQRSNNEAHSYACSQLEIACRPASGWHGASKSSLEYSVENKGDRDLSRLILRFKTTSGSMIDLDLDGPFPAGRTRSAVIEVPPRVDRSYFENSTVKASDIVGARF